MNDKPREPSSRVIELFEEGRKFTEELLRENERLRAMNLQLAQEKRDLGGQYVRVDVPSLQRKLALLEEQVVILAQQNQELRNQFASVEDENRQFAARYVDVERQNSELINLYVAAHRLHSTLRTSEVVQVIKEIVINMVGSECFGIYLLDSTQTLRLVAQEGLDETKPKAIHIGQGQLGEWAATGEPHVVPTGSPVHGDRCDPIACIPLKVNDRTIGVIAIYALLRQKEGFRPSDLEIFELLGGHAGTAVYVTGLHSVSERKRSTLESFVDVLRQQPIGG